MDSSSKLPSIGVFIPTQGRISLLRTLHSIAEQGLQEDDLCLVVGDGADPKTAETVPLFGHQFLYIPHAETKDWGHSQNNFGAKWLKDKVDIIVAQDDDDIFAPRFFDELRFAAQKSPGHLLINQVASHVWGLIPRSQKLEKLWEGHPNWDQPGKEVYAIDGHIVALPGKDGKQVPQYGTEYNGDQKYVLGAIELYKAMTTWTPLLATITRPSWHPGLHWNLYPWLHADQCYMWSFSQATKTPWIKPEIIATASLIETSDDYVTNIIVNKGWEGRGTYREIEQFLAVAHQGEGQWPPEFLTRIDPRNG